MNKAKKMGVEYYSIALATSSRAISKKESSMEEADRLEKAVPLWMENGRVARSMVFVYISIKIMHNMKATTTMTKNMHMVNLHM